jgi:hypothetical protein
VRCRDLTDEGTAPSPTLALLDVCAFVILAEREVLELRELDALDSLEAVEGCLLIRCDRSDMVRTASSCDELDSEIREA